MIHRVSDMSLTQNEKMQKIDSAITQIESDMNINANATGQLSVSIDELHDKSTQLKEQVVFFKVNKQQFQEDVAGGLDNNPSDTIFELDGFDMQLNTEEINNGDDDDMLLF
jgi:septal ring factor EnvC (AmiA/AmiB activator)